MHKIKAPYGSWPSPIPASMIARSGSGTSALPREVHADHTGVYWIEPRPQESGRYVLQHLDDGGSIKTLTPPDFSVRTRVHEYGGGSYLVADGVIFFSNEADQRIYRHEPGKQPQPVTPEPIPSEAFRFADGNISPDSSSIICVCERHQKDAKVENCLVRVLPGGGAAPAVLHSEYDFYANPRISPDGTRILWLSWNLPHMPWEGTDLWLGELADGKIIKIEHIAGSTIESIFQPEWGQDGEIYFVSDRTGWWNLYVYEDGMVRPITTLEVEFGLPLWTLAYKTYCLLPDRRIFATYLDKGKPGFVIIKPDEGKLEPVKHDFTYLGGSIDVDAKGRVWFLAGSGKAFPGLSMFDMSTGKFERIAEVVEVNIPEETIAFPEQIQFESPVGGTAYAYYYPPTHPDYTGLEAERPPLIVMGHGGPTSAARPYFKLEVQFWTTRGFAVVDVDYSGSTGYGRAYRDRLKGQWGIIDVADCVQAARHLVAIGCADPSRLIITGGSAGGYIVLCALTGYKDFATGASYYGVADLLTFIQDTHKFESGYDAYLIGPYPEHAETYRQRSPMNYADQISCPLILFQGLDDKVVPPSQSEILVDALEKNGIHYRYITFEGEAHGFRKSENLETALEAELSFYREVLKIQ